MGMQVGDVDYVFRPEPVLCTGADAEREFGIDQGTLRRLFDSGVVKGRRSLGGHRWYRRSSLYRWACPDLASRQRAQSEQSAAERMDAVIRRAGRLQRQEMAEKAVACRP